MTREEFYKKHNVYVYRVALSICQDMYDSEEVTSWVFEKLYSMNANLETISRSYLYSMTRNRIFDIAKLVVVRDTMPLTDAARYIPYDEFSEEDEIEKNDMITKLREALKTIPREQMEVYTLFYQNGLKAKEIALELNISINTVLGRLRYLRINIEKQLK